MGREIEVLLPDESCPVCGDAVVLYTSSRQRGGGWWAYDGDPVECSSCGHRGHISCDAESPAEVMMDDLCDDCDDCRLIGGDDG